MFNHIFLTTEIKGRNWTLITCWYISLHAIYMSLVDITLCCGLFQKYSFWSILLGHFIKHKPLKYLKTSLLPLLWTLLTQSCGFCKWGHLVMIISFFSLIESSKFHRMNIIYHGGQKWMNICSRSCEELVVRFFLKKKF